MEIGTGPNLPDRRVRGRARVWHLDPSGDLAKSLFMASLVLSGDGLVCNEYLAVVGKSQ
jgi:hypothetical protein